MRVLVVDDERRMAELLRRGLTADGLSVDVAHDGTEALWRAGATRYDAIVLDVMMPGLDGVTTCRRLREDDVWSPVLLLTARDAIEDRVAGLDAGADDYLVKPFALPELSARLRALARRGRAERPTVLRVGDLELDPASHRVRRGDVAIDLSPKEYSVLYALMAAPDAVLDRYELLERAWGSEYENRSNIIDVYISYLRQKIDRPFGTDSIQTVRGEGYRIRSAPAPSG
ncbi:response regulator transcription factor [Patulibacter minatonensis]|uniref:response regulator transcription factor n=1 Tax=Patulibacter minatonensis TaxID=298163 RepID=UPI00047C5F16|nr:response regulator transcription factor [Patulibacter minatonensis]